MHYYKIACGELNLLITSDLKTVQFVQLVNMLTTDIYNCVLPWRWVIIMSKTTLNIYFILCNKGLLQTITLYSTHTVIINTIESTIQTFSLNNVLFAKRSFYVRLYNKHTRLIGSLQLIFIWLSFKGLSSAIFKVLINLSNNVEHYSVLELQITWPHVRNQLTQIDWHVHARTHTYIHTHTHTQSSGKTRRTV